MYFLDMSFLFKDNLEVLGSVVSAARSSEERKDIDSKN